jgi:hypothetical protein
MIRTLTAKELEKYEQKIIFQANIWLQKYSPEQVSMFIWNKYGYFAGTKNGIVYFMGHNGRTTINQ